LANVGLRLKAPQAVGQKVNGAQADAADLEVGIGERVIAHRAFPAVLMPGGAS